MRAAHASPQRVSNVVYMGMGEPLANYDAVWESIERLHDDVGISARRITVSTVGVVPGIRRLAAERLPVTLAVSLHAATDELRNELVPLNRRYPIAAGARRRRRLRGRQGPACQGKLLLAHGTLDGNVPPYNTLLVVDALIKANKDFDLIMFPNRAHGFGSEPYMVRRRWDFFVKHLMGAEPPQGFELRPASGTPGS